MAAMGLGRIYTFGPTFRAENSNTTRHVAEFWHVEPEVAFAELPDIIEIALRCRPCSAAASSTPASKEPSVTSMLTPELSSALRRATSFTIDEISR